MCVLAAFPNPSQSDSKSQVGYGLSVGWVVLAEPEWTARSVWVWQRPGKCQELKLSTCAAIGVIFISINERPRCWQALQLAGINLQIDNDLIIAGTLGIEAFRTSILWGCYDTFRACAPSMQLSSKKLWHACQGQFFFMIVHAHGVLAVCPQG